MNIPDNGNRTTQLAKLWYAAMFFRRLNTRGNTPVDDNSRFHDMSNESGGGARWTERSAMKGNWRWIKESWNDIFSPAQYFKGRSFFTGMNMWMHDIAVTIAGTILFGMVNLFYLTHPYIR